MECIFLVMILGIMSLGFGVALQSSAHVPDGVDGRLAVHTYLVDKMEDIKSLDFATVAANHGLSDTVKVNGQTLARTVSVVAVDADGIAGAEADYVEVTVTISDQFLKMRLTEP